MDSHLSHSHPAAAPRSSCRSCSETTRRGARHPLPPSNPAETPSCCPHLQARAQPWACRRPHAVRETPRERRLVSPRTAMPHAVLPCRRRCCKSQSAVAALRSRRPIALQPEHSLVSPTKRSPKQRSSAKLRQSWPLIFEFTSGSDTCQAATKCVLSCPFPEKMRGPCGPLGWSNCFLRLCRFPRNYLRKRIAS